MSELLPCPFCGGEMKTDVVTFDVEFYESPYEQWYLEHSDLDAAANEHCPIPTTDTFYATEAEAIEAWNSRAERTCKLIRHGSLANMPSFVCWSCSECDFGWHHSENDKQFSYCPNCGARVTPKNSETTPKVVS